MTYILLIISYLDILDNLFLINRILLTFLISMINFAQISIFQNIKKVISSLGIVSFLLGSILKS